MTYDKHEYVQLELSASQASLHFFSYLGLIPYFYSHFLCFIIVVAATTSEFPLGICLSYAILQFSQSSALNAYFEQLDHELYLCANNS